MEGNFRVGDWLVRLDLNRLERQGERRPVEPKALEVLRYLARNAERLCPREEIIEKVWPDIFVNEEALTNAVSKLRQALGDDPRSPRYIQTISRRGYRLAVPVRWVPQLAQARYRVLGKLGEGAVAEVYLAEDSSLRRKIALKLLKGKKASDEAWHRRLLREARLAAALDHPFICKVYEAGEADGQAFIAMEYLEGRTLADRLAAGPLDFDEAIKVGIEVAEALEVAQQKGIIHRDLKPGNLMLTPQGHVKVMDFGMAKRLPQEGAGDWSTSLTQAGVMAEEFVYRAPEQINSQQAPDFRTDVFSLGLLIYEMLAGEHPFKRDSPISTVLAVVAEAPPLHSLKSENWPARLIELLKEMLAKAPEKRCRSMSEVAGRLRAIRSPGAFAEILESLRRSAFRWVLVGVVLLVLVALGWWLWA